LGERRAHSFNEDHTRTSGVVFVRLSHTKLSLFANFQCQLFSLYLGQ